MSLTHVATEILAYALAVLFWRQARRRQALLMLVTATLFGFTVEYVNVKTLTDYCYGEFMVMLPPMWWPVTPDFCPVGPRVPLWGTLVWGTLIYGAMTLSSSMEIPWPVRPLYDGLLVLTVDWILDPLATWRTFWTWTPPPGLWFGIPLDNYAGWFLLVVSFSLTFRAAQAIVPRVASGWVANLIVAVVTIAVGIGLLKAGLEVYVWLLGRGVDEPLLLLTLLGVPALIVIAYAVRVPGDATPQWLIFGAAVVTHVFYTGLIVATGLSGKYPLLLGVAAATFVMTVVGYSWPFRRSVYVAMRSLGGS